MGSESPYRDGTNSATLPTALSMRNSVANRTIFQRATKAPGEGFVVHVGMPVSGSVGFRAVQ